MMNAQQESCEYHKRIIDPCTMNKKLGDRNPIFFVFSEIASTFCDVIPYQGCNNTELVAKSQTLTIQ